MSQEPIAVWLTPNPVFHSFHSPLLRYLSSYGSIAHWEYLQSQDEGSCLENPLHSLEEYFKTLLKPVHLIGHGLGGWLGLCYARQYPEQVKSLTLLGVGVNYTWDWQAYYYSLFKQLRCPKSIILEQMVYSLFGEQNIGQTRYLLEVLRRDLLCSPSPHSLYEQVSGEEGEVDVPLFVCGSENDSVVPPTAILGWKKYIHLNQNIWLIPSGYHCFHYFYPHCVGQKIIAFWRSDQIIDREHHFLLQNTGADLNSKLDL